jgi:hypothetical protein
MPINARLANARSNLFLVVGKVRTLLAKHYIIIHLNITWDIFDHLVVRSISQLATISWAVLVVQQYTTIDILYYMILYPLYFL